MSIIDTLVTDRRAGSFYSAEDLNRLCQAIYYVADTLSQNGYPSAIQPTLLPTDRTSQNYFYLEDGEIIIATMEQLRANFASLLPAAIPATFQYLDYRGANRLEQFLAELYALLQGSVAQFPKCGTLECE